MLRRLLGIGRTWGATANDSPIGCPGVGYGSWPTMRTLTPANGCWKARNTCSPAGRYVCPAAISERRNSPIEPIRSATGCSAAAQPDSTTSVSERVVIAEILVDSVYRDTGWESLECHD